MKTLALVTDAFGGSGGIARYNRNLLTALADNAIVKTVEVLPRYGADEALPAGIHQFSPVAGKLAYARKAWSIAGASQPYMIFCGHIGLMPIAWLLSRRFKRSLWLQLLGIEAWQLVSAPLRRMIETASLAGLPNNNPTDSVRENSPFSKLIVKRCLEPSGLNTQL